MTRVRRWVGVFCALAGSFEQFQQIGGSYHIYKTITKLKLAASRSKENTHEIPMVYSRISLAEWLTNCAQTFTNKQSRIVSRLVIKVFKYYPPPPTAYYLAAEFFFLREYASRAVVGLIREQRLSMCRYFVPHLTRICQTLDHRIKSHESFEENGGRDDAYTKQQIKRVFLRKDRNVRKTNLYKIKKCTNERQQLERNECDVRIWWISCCVDECHVCEY